MSPELCEPRSHPDHLAARPRRLFWETGLLLTNSGPHVTSFTSTETLKQPVYQSLVYQSDKSFSNSKIISM